MSDNKFLPLFCVPCFLYHVTIPQWNGCGGCVGLLKSSCPCYCHYFKFCETSNFNDWNVSQLQKQGFRSGKVVSTQLRECLIRQAWSSAAMYAFSPHMGFCTHCHVFHNLVLLSSYWWASQRSHSLKLIPHSSTQISESLIVSIWPKSFSLKTSLQTSIFLVLFSNFKY